MMHQDSLEPATIRFTLECLQESARRSRYFSLLFKCIYIGLLLRPKYPCYIGSSDVYIAKCHK